MLKIYIFLILLGVLIYPARICLPEITQDYDDSTEKSDWISTFRNVGDFEQVIFLKETSSSKYTLALVLKRNRKILFSAAEAWFPGKHYHLFFLGVSFDTNKEQPVTIKAAFDISPAARDILTTQSATIILETRRGEKINWDVPYFVLEEWQDVIKRQ